MIILWYAEFEGSYDDLKKVNKKMDKIAKKAGVSYQGPFYPQDAGLMYILNVDKYERLNEMGRAFLPWVEKQGINITPLRYEVAVTADEFWGK